MWQQKLAAAGDAEAAQCRFPDSCLLWVQVAFFLPQLVQLLRDDGSGQIAAFLLQGASTSVIFAHTLICTLRVGVMSGWLQPPAFGVLQMACNSP